MRVSTAQIDLVSKTKQRYVFTCGSFLLLLLLLLRIRRKRSSAVENVLQLLRVVPAMASLVALLPGVLAEGALLTGGRHGVPSPWRRIHLFFVDPAKDPLFNAPELRLRCGFGNTAVATVHFTGRRCDERAIQHLRMPLTLFFQQGAGVFALLCRLGAVQSALFLTILVNGLQDVFDALGDQLNCWMETERREK